MDRHYFVAVRKRQSLHWASSLPSKKQLPVNATAFLHLFHHHPQIKILEKALCADDKYLHLKGLMGSATAITLATLFDQSWKQQYLVVLSEKEEAVYFYNDLEALLCDSGLDHNKKRVLFYPTTYKRPYCLSACALLSFTCFSLPA